MKVGKKMTTSEMERGLILLAAEKDIPDFKTAAMRTQPRDSTDGDEMAITIAVQARCADGAVGYAEIVLDMKTGRELIPWIENVVGDAIAALGVKP